MNVKYLFRSLFVVFVAFSIYSANAMDNACFRKKKKEDQKEKSTPDAYDKAIAGAKSQDGLFTVYFTKKNSLLFAIPDSLFSRDFALASRVASTSDTREVVAGIMATSPFLVRFSADSSNVYLRQGQEGVMVRKNDPITPSFKKNMVDPILKTFKIIARKNGKVLIDVTDFFRTNTKCISPLKILPPGMENPFAIKGQYVDNASRLTGVKSFPKNIEIDGFMTFSTQPYYEPYTLGMHRSLVLLPIQPMAMRLQDNRVGFFNSRMTCFSSDKDHLYKFKFIHRWRLEPKDSAAYARGELVEPKKPIIFYVDTAFPEKWRPTIRIAVQDWQKAFEKAGFKNAIIAKDYPTKQEDPNFDPDNINYTCIKYATTPIANAMGPSYIDPRSGEILCADVIWYHNVLSLVHDWRFVQTAAVDPEARKIVFSDSLMRDCLRYVAAHEVGHTLGLMHNMGASYSFPLDSLRSPTFTQKYGTTPSIMDYARNNYVAQPGDLERGVKLTPPILGVYDINAINWGYRLIPGADSPEAELPTLRKWIAEKANDPMYKFGAQQAPFTIDPTAQTEDLSSDQFGAGDLSIKNLKIIAKNILNWEKVKGNTYEQIEDMYLQLIMQYIRHISHIRPYVGGIIFDENRQGDGKNAYNYVTKAQQKKAVAWLMNQARTVSGWLFDPAVLDKMNFRNSPRIQQNIIRNMIVGSLFDTRKLNRIYMGGQLNNPKNYKLYDYVQDASKEVFMKSYQGKRLTNIDQMIEGAAIVAMGKLANPKVFASSKSRRLAEEELNADLSNLIKKSELPCAHLEDAEETHFFRPTFMEQPIDNDVIAPIMMQKLSDIKKLYKVRLATASGEQRAFYSYQIQQIDKILDPK